MKYIFLITLIAIPLVYSANFEKEYSYDEDYDESALGKFRGRGSYLDEGEEKFSNPGYNIENKERKLKYDESETDDGDSDEVEQKREFYDLADAPRLFEEFVKKFNKKYSSDEEKKRRYNNFVKSLKSINELNAEGGSASFGINIMADEDSE